MRIPLTPALFTRTSSRFCCAVKTSAPDLMDARLDRSISKNSSRPRLFGEALLISEMALEAFVA